MNATLRIFIIIALLSASVFFIIQSVLGLVAIITIFKGFDILDSFTNRLQSQTKDGFEEQNNQLTNLAPSSDMKVEIIEPDNYQTFMLRGGKHIAVVNSLTVKVGSENCKKLIEEKKGQVLDILAEIFLTKDTIDITTPAGLDLLKKQIREGINSLISFSNTDSSGVLSVYIYIKSIESVQ